MDGPDKGLTNSAILLQYLVGFFGTISPSDLRCLSKVIFKRKFPKLLQYLKAEDSYTDMQTVSKLYLLENF